MTQTKMKHADLPVRVFQPPGGEPYAIMGFSEFMVLFELARGGAEHNDEAVVRATRSALGRHDDRVVANFRSFLTTVESAQHLRNILAHQRPSWQAALKSTSGVFEPIGPPSEIDADEAADIAAYEEAKARGEEAFPLEVAERLIEGENAIKVFRGYRGMTQAELAKLAGLSAMYISQIETGRRSGSTKALRRIAAALEINLADLVD